MAIGLLTVAGSVYVGTGIYKSGMKLYSALNTKRNIKLAESKLEQIVNRTNDMAIRAKALKEMDRTINEVKEVSYDPEFTQEVLYGNGTTAFMRNIITWPASKESVERAKEFAYKYIIA